MKNSNAAMRKRLAQMPQEVLVEASAPWYSWSGYALERTP